MQLNLSGKRLRRALSSKLFKTMKLAVVLIILGCLQISAKGYSQSITLNVNGASLDKVFSAIEKQSDYHFFYKYNDLKLASPVTIQVANASLEETLKQCFKNEPLTYSIEQKTIIVVKKEPVPVTAPAAKIKVTGQVKDETGETLPGVTVTIKGANNAVVTDTQGDFIIEADNNATLLFSFIGYSVKEEPINSRTVINVQLELNNKQLNDVVVIGYGNQERKDVTGAVGSVRMANIAEIKTASLDLKLAGQLAGVTVNQVTGTPGGGVAINIRGAGSVGAGDNPLYVIDGFPLSPDFDQYSNPLSTINPDDIESISVLKDAASTAIYGSRGSNGVILITTKRAKKGEASIALNTFTGIQTILPQSELKMMTASQFAEFRIQAQQDDDKANGVPFNISQVPAAYRNPAALGNGTNWFNAVTRVAPQQNYDVTVSNGTDKVRSLFSAGYFEQDGTVLNTGFQRYSLRANIDDDVAKNVTIGLSLAPTYSLRNLQQTDGHFDSGVLSQALLESPLSPVKQPDGSYTTVIGSPGTFQNANPVSELVNTTNKYTQFRTLANLYADWKIIDGLDVKSTFGVDYQNSTGNYYRPSYLGGFNVQNQQAAGSFNSSNSLNWLNENTVNYKKTWGNSSLTALAGYTIQQENDHNRLTYGTGYPDDAIQSVGDATIVTASAGDSEWRLLSFLSRAEYAYKDKYLLNASIRRDGSTRFAPGHQWGTFPSVSAGWRISDESFFPKTDVLDEVKLTGSFGFAGNNDVGEYDYIGSVSTTNYTFGGVIAPGKSLSTLGNTELGWETTRQLDIGLDISLVKGRIYLITEFYNRYTERLLQDIAIPIVSGYGDSYTNVGNVRNRGWEFTLTTKNIVGSGFNWTSDFNISFNRNKVLSLGSNPNILAAPSNDNATSITEVGLPLGQFYGYTFVGIFQNQKQLDNNAHFAGEQVGNIQYKDISGPNGKPDGVIDSYDEGPIGNPWPLFTFGFNNHLSYKNFDMNIVTAGSVGGHVFDVYKQFTTNLDGVFNVEQSVAQRWRPGNPGAGILPTTVSNTNLARDYFPSYWVENNSYLEVKDISLGYNFKTKFSKNFRVYVSAQNAILFTGYKGGNPEVGIDTDAGNRSLSPNVNFNAYPVSAVYTLGCNVTF